LIAEFPDCSIFPHHSIIQKRRRIVVRIPVCGRSLRKDPRHPGPDPVRPREITPRSFSSGKSPTASIRRPDACCALCHLSGSRSGRSPGLNFSEKEFFSTVIWIPWPSGDFRNDDRAMTGSLSHHDCIGIFSMEIDWIPDRLSGSALSAAPQDVAWSSAGLHATSCASTLASGL